MLRAHGVCVLALVAGGFLFGLSQPASAGLSILSQSVSVDQSAEQVDFSLTFNHVPDFLTADSIGRHADSFQYEIIPNTLTPIGQLPFGDIRAVIRGDEIGASHTVPIRDGTEHGSDPSAIAGGWGSIRGAVPFTLTGDTLSFVAPFNLLDTTNGRFSYRVFTTNFGSTVSMIDSASISVPLPMALPGAVMILAGLGFMGWRRSKMKG